MRSGFAPPCRSGRSSGSGCATPGPRSGSPGPSPGRWESVWFLEIAQFGYADPTRAAFFPLYPALVSLGGWLGSPLIAGIVVSSGCGLASLYLLHRLVAIDLRLEDARATVLIVAW